MNPQRKGLLCRVGLHHWRMFGPFRESGRWRAMWARCDRCPSSKYLMPNGGKYPLRYRRLDRGW